MATKKVTDGLMQLINELESKTHQKSKTVGALILPSDTKVLTTSEIKSIAELKPDNGNKPKVHSEMGAIEKMAFEQFRKNMEDIDEKQKRDTFVLEYVSKQYVYLDSAIDLEIYIKKQVANGIEVYNAIRKELDAN